MSEYLQQKVGPDGQPPPGTGPPRQDRAEEIPQDQGQDQASKATYASKVTGSKNERMKLNVLDVYLDKKDNTVSFILSKEELAKLLFKKMALLGLEKFSLNLPAMSTSRQ
jgi:hypothetical protein